MAKLIDVANRAGVSITTASMALSGKGRISQEVRQKVYSSADELNYKRRRTDERSQWLLIINMNEYDYLSHFFNSIIRELQTAALSNDHTLTILPFWENVNEDELYQGIKNTNANSVFSIHFVSEQLMNRLESMDIPCVIINNTTFTDKFFSVCVDDFHGAYEGTIRLIQAGHREIAYIDYPRRTLPGIMADRFFGFRKAMEENNLVFPDKWRKTIDYKDYSQIETALHELLHDPLRKPTAFFIHDDMLAAKIVYILNKMNLSIPDDISIIAPGDTLNYSQMETPQLSTMKIDTGLMGQYAVTMLLERLQKGEQAAHLLRIKQSFQDRGSIKIL